jgi:hypothetical protein
VHGLKRLVGVAPTDGPRHPIEQQLFGPPRRVDGDPLRQIADDD